MSRNTYWIAALFFFQVHIALGQTAHTLACQGEIQRLDSMLQTGTAIDLPGKRGRSLLHYAVGCRQEEVLHFLLELGIDVTMKDEGGHTPLYVAIHFNDRTYFDPIMAQHSTDDFSEVYGALLLEKAVLQGNKHFVEQLIAKDVALDVQNDRGNTPLAVAVREGYQGIAEKLKEAGADTNLVQLPIVTGDYMGQPAPGDSAIVFAPNFISTEYFVHNGVFHPNGKEFYFTIESRIHHRGTIMVSRSNNGQWSLPEAVSIPGDNREIGPFISSDGEEFYFATDRPVASQDSVKKELDLWKMEREGEGWSQPEHLGDELNTAGNDWFPSVSALGNMYYYVQEGKKGTIYTASKSDKGAFSDPVPVAGIGNGTHYNYDPFIATDEQFLIFCSRDRPDGFGNADLYISFRDTLGKWSLPKNMGPSVNTEADEYAPTITPDGNYLMFTRGYGDIYWITSDLIEDLRDD